MRWIIDVDRSRAAPSLEWVRSFAEQFELSLVEWIRIDRGSGRFRGVYGRCWYPTRQRPTYRLSCQVPGPFPTSVETRQRPIYPRPDGTWPAIPRGLHPRGYGHDPRTGRVWLKLGARTLLADINEGIVWIFGHEMFHFLRRTRQIPGRNTEIEADAFADRCLVAFRAGQLLTREACQQVPATATATGIRRVAKRKRSSA